MTDLDYFDIMRNYANTPAMGVSGVSRASPAFNYPQYAPGSYNALASSLFAPQNPGVFGGQLWGGTYDHSSGYAGIPLLPPQVMGGVLGNDPQGGRRGIFGLLAR